MAVQLEAEIPQSVFSWDFGVEYLRSKICAGVFEVEESIEFSGKDLNKGEKDNRNHKDEQQFFTATLSSVVNSWKTNFSSFFMDIQKVPNSHECQKRQNDWETDSEGGVVGFFGFD